MFNFWWLAEWSEWWTVTEIHKKGLLSHQKIKCSFSDGLPEDCQKNARRPAEDKQKTTRRLAEDQQKTSRRLPEYWQKARRRQAEDYQKSNRWPAEDCQKTARRPPEDYQKTTIRLPEDCQKTTRPSAEWSEQKALTKIQKKQKRPPKSLKNKMFIFGIHSTSDDWPSDLSKKHQPKCKKIKKAP